MTWIFKELPNPPLWRGLTKDPDYFPARTCWVLVTYETSPYSSPLSPDRRVFKAVLCGLAWTSGTYSLLWQFLLLFFPRLQGPLFDQSSPTIQRAGSVPNCQNTGQNSQRPRVCLPLLSWAWCSDPSRSATALFPIRKCHRDVITAIQSISLRRERISPASSPLNTHGIDLRIKRQQTFNEMVATPAR